MNDTSAGTDLSLKAAIWNKPAGSDESCSLRATKGVTCLSATRTGSPEYSNHALGNKAEYVPLPRPSLFHTGRTSSVASVVVVLWLLTLILAWKAASDRQFGSKPVFSRRPQRVPMESSAPIAMCQGPNDPARLNINEPVPIPPTGTPRFVRLTGLNPGAALIGGPAPVAPGGWSPIALRQAASGISHKADPPPPEPRSSDVWRPLHPPNNPAAAAVGMAASRIPPRESGGCHRQPTSRSVKRMMPCQSRCSIAMISSASAASLRIDQ